MKKLLWVGLVGLAAAPVAALAAESLSVKLREATVRQGPKPFKPVVTVVRYGDKVTVLSRKDAWLEVEAPNGQKGFLHESATTDKPVPKAAAGAQGAGSGGARDETAMAGKGFRRTGSVTNDEVALAGKGFNPQVEKQYRVEHQELEAAFAKVDAMEKRAVDRGELERFMSEGKLGDGGAQ